MPENVKKLVKKDVKLFEAGNYLVQGNYPFEKVKAIFENTGDSISTHYIHKSHLEKKGVTPLDMGEFTNLTMSDSGEIRADIEFNEKGTEYYNDGSVTGWSIELDFEKNIISSVAFLPPNANPQIPGAEFSETNKITIEGKFEFEKKEFETTEIVEQINSLDPSVETEEALYSIQDAIWAKTDEKWYIDKLISSGYKVEKTVSEFEGLSIEEITRRVQGSIESKFKAKETGKALFEKLKNDGKITPAMEKAGLNAEFMAITNYSKGKKVEFGEDSLDVSGIIPKILEAMPPLINLGGSLQISEFETIERSYEEKVADAKKLMEVV